MKTSERKPPRRAAGLRIPARTAPFDGTDGRAEKGRGSRRFLWRLASFLLLAQVTNGTCASDLTISFAGPEETVMSNGAWGLTCMPDEPVSFRRTNGMISFWFTGNGGSNGAAQFFVGTNFSDLHPYRTNQGIAASVLGGSGTGFDADYAGPGSVIQSANGGKLLMVYHAEAGYQTCGRTNAKVSIGIASSADGGQTWTRLGQIITGQEAVPQCTRFNGAGAPSVCPSPDGNYLYLYFMDWGTNYPAEIRLARALRSSDGQPGSWFKYYGGAFSQPGIGGLSDPVIHRPSPAAVWVGYPNISFNSYLNQYLGVVTCDDGWYCASSQDGISWGVPQLFFGFPTPYSQLQTGDPVYLYPTFLSVGEQNQLTTSRTGCLYYAYSPDNTGCHYMARRAASIQAGCDLVPCPDIVNPLVSGNVLKFTLDNLIPGTAYYVERQSSLEISNNWAVVSSFVAGGAVTNLSIPLGSKGATAFYTVGRH